MAAAPDKPLVVVLGGPNGAGKSTLASRVLQGAFGVDEFVNADLIAQGISGFAPDRAAVAAGRIMLRRIDELCRDASVLHSSQRSPVAAGHHDVTTYCRDTTLWKEIRQNGGCS